jgi:hypothetical protein
MPSIKMYTYHDVYSFQEGDALEFYKQHHHDDEDDDNED